MRKIAVEEHYETTMFDHYLPDITARLNFPNLFNPEHFKERLAGIIHAPPEQDRLPVMDRNGIAIQVLSSGTWVVQNLPDPAEAVKVSRQINDLLHELISQYPDRFRGFAMLPMQDVDAAVTELRRCVTELGFVGVMLNGPTNFTYYDDPRFDPFWAALQELDVPMCIHPANPPADQISIYDGYPELLGNTWNWGYHTATHVLRIMFGGVFDRFPGVQMIVCHMGEGLPYLLGRMDEGYDARKVKALGRMAHHPSYYFRHNLYINTSGGFRPEAMACAISALGCDRILFANDYPHFPTATSVAQVEACALTHEQREMIYFKNAERLFRVKG